MRDTYIHGTVPEEQRRLALMNDLINAGCLRELALSPGEHVLDVGSGTGQFARVMAAAVGPEGCVVGVERDAEQRAEAQRLGEAVGEAIPFELREGEAAALPLQPEEWGTFDVVHARFLLEHVQDPLAVVRQMARAVRPGGRVVLADDDHDLLRLWPEVPGFQALWKAYYRTYDRLGNDPFVGRRLVALLYAAGARPQRNTWVFFGGCAGEDRFEAATTNMAEVVRGARETILEHGFFEEQYLDETLNAFETWSRRPDAALWYALSWAEGHRAPNGA